MRVRLNLSLLMTLTLNVAFSWVWAGKGGVLLPVNFGLIEQEGCFAPGDKSFCVGLKLDE